MPPANLPEADSLTADHTPPRSRVFVAGASGYIGQQLVRELVGRGHSVVCLVREHSAPDLQGAEIRVGDVCDADSVSQDGFRGEPFDAVFSCLGSRGGGVKDAWAVEFSANQNLLASARESAADHFVLLSAICVQKPELAFQHAKLAFEEALVQSGVCYSIVRPTAFFKSLSGQVEAVRDGKRFTVFGDGELTACKPIAEAELACFMADCLTDPSKHNAILPIGGPGPALTPNQQGELLFELCGRPARFRRVPLGLFDTVIALLGLFAKMLPALRDTLEFARIGRYYASESMLILDPLSQQYDADGTPEFGMLTLRDHYTRVLSEGMSGQELGDHALFDRRRK